PLTSTNTPFSGDKIITRKVKQLPDETNAKVTTRREHVRRAKEIINVRPQNLTFSPFGLSTNRERRATDRPALSLREIVEETDSEEVEYNGMNDNVWKSGEQMGKGHDGA
ncbi:hypothetical protein LTR33_013131, partial [Friedmanniomyces endolithicus]